jgi:hypothetical protein
MPIWWGFFRFLPIFYAIFLAVINDIGAFQNQKNQCFFGKRSVIF